MKHILLPFLSLLVHCRLLAAPTLVNIAWLAQNEEQNTVVFGHTGHSASLSWSVMHEILEKGNTILYDASSRAWARRSDSPITQEVGIKH